MTEMLTGPRRLPPLAAGQANAERWVQEHLGHLVSRHMVGDAESDLVGSVGIRGGQRAADSALANFDVAGYASQRNEVYPQERRGASRLSPYIRHGLLSLPQVWAATGDDPERDVQKFHDELLWQEFARHWYARHGSDTGHGIRRSLPVSASSTQIGFDRSMACIDFTVIELERDGWLVNQTRMWLASHWAIRHGKAWQDGEDWFFRHLLDGSRAANRLGWQWTTGVGSSKHYGFSRWQVNKRAPGLCASCSHRNSCPIEDWPDDPVFIKHAKTSHAEPADPTQISGPLRPLALDDPELVWLTAESLGDEDPALVAHPDLPVMFIFDEPLLRRLELSAKRLVFLTETLAELAEHRDLTIMLGDPVDALADRAVSVTFAPVPGFAARANRIEPVDIQPWRWLRVPRPGPVTSFSAWRRNHR